MWGTPRFCDTLRSTPLGNLDPVIRLFEGNFLDSLREAAQESRISRRLPWPRTGTTFGATREFRDRSSGDTIPNCLGELAEIRDSKERTGIAADGHRASTRGVTGVERLRPQENDQRSDGGERGRTDRIFRRN